MAVTELATKIRRGNGSPVRKRETVAGITQIYMEGYSAQKSPEYKTPCGSADRGYMSHMSHNDPAQQPFEDPLRHAHA
jgi:hypothetical protein